MVKDFDDVNERGKGFFGLHVERVYGSVYRAVLMTDLLQVESWYLVGRRARVVCTD